MAANQTTIITQTGRELRVTAVATGRNFGYIGRVSARNGRTVATTDHVYPFREAAFEAAERLAARL